MQLEKQIDLLKFYDDDTKTLLLAMHYNSNLPENI